MTIFILLLGSLCCMGLGCIVGLSVFKSRKKPAAEEKKVYTEFDLSMAFEFAFQEGIKCKGDPTKLMWDFKKYKLIQNKTGK